MSYTTKWIKQTTYVDAETGETLPPINETEYYIIKIIKNGTEFRETKKSRTGIAKYIKLVRKRPIQTEIKY